LAAVSARVMARARATAMESVAVELVDSVKKPEGLI
jgi:hypothetical protein